MIRSTVTAAVLACCLPSATQCLFGQGFGLRKTTMRLTRVVPPNVDLMDKRIKVEAKATSAVPPALVNNLRTKLITELQQDTRRIIDEKTPQIILRFTVTNFHAANREERRQCGNTPCNATVVTGDLQVSYQALNTENDAPVDSENLQAKYKEEFGQGAARKGGIFGGVPGLGQHANKGGMPDANELMNILVSDIVAQMARRAVTTDENFEVNLPGDKLKDASRLAQGGRWVEVAKEVESMTPFPKPEDDAYRFYMLGLAYEGQAYASTDQKSTRSHLANASINYKKAKQAKPKEEYFDVPENRVRLAIVHYDKLDRQRAEYDKYLAEKKGGKSVGGGATEPAGSGDSDDLDNATIITMVKRGMDVNLISTLVKTGPNPKFKTSPQELLKLSDAGVPSPLISAMMERMAALRNPQVVPAAKTQVDNGAPPAPAPPPGAAKPAGTVRPAQPKPAAPKPAATTPVTTKKQ
jgi:hypothetical protein